MNINQNTVRNIDISRLFNNQAKEALKKTLILGKKLNQKKVGINHLVKVLLNNSQVKKISRQFGIKPKKINAKIEGKKPHLPLKVTLTNKLKRVVFLAFQESLFANRQEVTPLDLFISALPFVKPDVDLEKARMKTIEILGGSPHQLTSSILDQFTTNLTEQAVSGKLHKIIGRDKEIQQVIRVLGRKTKSNAVLIGDAGVGKTAIVEGLAQLIVAKKVPNLIKDVQILSLNLTSLLAGASYQGQLETRIEALIKEIKSKGNIILFIDEIHMIVGAGSATGTMTAANILKPALARGELHVIGATTAEEYRKHIEKDPALSRRFEPVKVEEPNQKDSLKILQSVAKGLTKHHQVKIRPEAIKASVDLSKRYIQDRRLPDKAIDLLDEATSASRLSDKKEVTEEDIKHILSQRTGIPIQSLSEQESINLMNLEKEIKKHIIGQNHAVDAVADVIKRARAGLKDPNRPIGSFLLLGPTGVGKTELAKVLTKVVYQDEKAMIRLDMSEFGEPHTADRLVGSPPGYVGYEEGGQLTNPVRLRPYSLILLDEIEKAHPKLFDVFLQVLEDGRLTDAQGHTADFKNTIIIMTSNVDVSQYIDKSMDQIDRNDLMKALTGYFRPEFLNRIDDIIVMNSLEKDDLKQIARLLTDKLNQRLKEKDIQVKVAEAGLDQLVEQADTKHFGARPLKRLIQNKIEEPLSELIISGKVKPGQNIAWPFKK